MDAPQTHQGNNASDIVASHWLLRHAPVGVRPYLKLARVDRPIGVWLLLFPCWWSLSLGAADLALNGGSQGGSADPSQVLILAVLFAIGAFVMRGAGCTFNDIVDRDFDARVARTATRPLPSGQVTLQQAYLFLGAQLLTGLLVLLNFNIATILTAVASLVLVIAYPFMKRITYWPQAWLGLTFNWGALLGWTAIQGTLDWPILLLYLGGIAWTLGYDTIYAHQDKDDDILIGVKSTALKFGAATKPWLIFFYGTTTVLLLAAGFSIALGWPFWVAMGAIAIQFGWQIAALNLDDPVDCMSKFKSNRFTGWVFVLGVWGAVITTIV